MMGVGVERMLLFTHSAHDSPTENDPHPQISTVSTGEKLCKRGLGVMETGKHCVQENLPDDHDLLNKHISSCSGPDLYRVGFIYLPDS